MVPLLQRFRHFSFVALKNDLVNSIATLLSSIISVKNLSSFTAIHFLGRAGGLPNRVRMQAGCGNVQKLFRLLFGS